MTVKEIRAILAENAASLRETDRIVQETSRQIQETKQIMKENAEKTDKQMRETDLKIAQVSEQVNGKIAEVSKQINGVTKQIGGIDNNIGYHAEQFFQNVFADKKVFGGIKYDNIILNMKHSEEDEGVEFDIVLRKWKLGSPDRSQKPNPPEFCKKTCKRKNNQIPRIFP